MSVKYLDPVPPKAVTPAPVPAAPPAPKVQVDVHVPPQDNTGLVDALAQALPLPPRAWEFTIHRDRQGRIDKVTARAVED